MSKIQYAAMLFLIFSLQTNVYAATKAIISKIYPNDAISKKYIEIIRLSEVNNSSSALLNEGDKIKFNNKNSIVEILINYKEKIEITYEMTKDNHYTIESHQSSLLQNALSMLNDRLSLKKEELFSFSSSTRGKNDSDLVVPFNTSDNTKIVCKPRRLFIAWKGGQSPYTVIFMHNNNVIFSQNSITTNEITTPEINWPEGVVTFALLQNGNLHIDTNTDDAWIDNSLHFVSEKNRPDIPDEINKLDIDSELKLYLYSQWLATLDDGSWAWEGVNIANSISDSFLPAKIWLSSINR